MIGQKALIDIINSQIGERIFPQFAVFVGDEGSGKKTIMNEIANNWRFSYTCDDVKVDTIRSMIEFCQKTHGTERCVYIIPDAQNMSLQAKNSLLKIVEEPPKSATFLMSVTSLSDIPGTIQSRGTIYRMEKYSKDELSQVLTRQDALDREFILSVSNTISDVQKLNRSDLDAIRKQVNVILEKADKLSYGNLLKSGQNMSFDGKDDDKIDLRLFFNAFMQECLTRLANQQSRSPESKMYIDMIIDTSSRLNDIKIKSVNKQMTYEDWLLTIRDIRESYGNIKGQE